MHVSCRLVLQLLSVLPQPAAALASRAQVLDKVVNWQARDRVLSLTLQDYLVVSIAGRGDS